MQKILHLFLLLAFAGLGAAAQSRKTSAASKSISPDLFGIFFEDISYAADGGLYAELVQNRSFEYSPSDRREWNAFTAWQYVTEGYGYGTVSVETSQPVNANNPHYLEIDVEEEGRQGIGLSNSGYDGIPVRAGSTYLFSVYARGLSNGQLPMTVKLAGNKGEILGETALDIAPGGWKKYAAAIRATKTEDSARLLVLVKSRGRIALDEISLFPENTFRNRPNGLRADLAQAIADLHPKFMRFPGGCLVHGDGLGNMYRWKNTIGPVEDRVQQRNIWNYHQSAGLGFFEYFQFCEDIGAKPLPVLPAAVSCQNSGGTWRIGGTGQRGLPLSEMSAYIRDVLDLIEYANGPASSAWGAKRAAAGHPAPFQLQYIGIGNEDKQTDAFRERFQMIYDAIKTKHPEITIVGTVGPAPEGEDFGLGWKLANQLRVPVVDEHYYEKPEWFLANQHRYDGYDRKGSKVYIGEYASRGNTLYNALCEAVYMASMERNGDLVQMASYAPLLASMHHSSWNPNLIYFDNTTVIPTANYYVQQMFSRNEGSLYYSGVVAIRGTGDSTLAASCVQEAGTGDIIIKLVNAGAEKREAEINLPGFRHYPAKAVLTVLAGNPSAKNTVEEPKRISPESAAISVKKSFLWSLPAYSLQVIRVKSRGEKSAR